MAKPKKEKKIFDYNVPEMRKLLDKALSIDNSSDYALDEAMKEHSRLHAEWGALSAKAQKLYRLLEIDLKTTTAQVATDIRQNAASQGKPLAVTAPVEKEMVPLKAEWKVACKNLITMGEYVDILSSVEKAFNNRAWLLIRLAKGREASVEPHVRGQQRGKNKPVEMEEYDL
jgi:hypothetical protein